MPIPVANDVVIVAATYRPDKQSYGRERATAGTKRVTEDSRAIRFNRCMFPVYSPQTKDAVSTACKRTQEQLIPGAQNETQPRLTALARSTPQLQLPASRPLPQPHLPEVRIRSLEEIRRWLPTQGVCCHPENSGLAEPASLLAVGVSFRYLRRGRRGDEPPINRRRSS